MDLNKVMLIGRLTRDPEIRTTPTGQTVASFSIATNRTWKDSAGNKKEKVEYHNIVAWRKLAEIIQQYVKKGSRLYLEGRLETRSWDDQTGNKKYRTEVIADSMIMLDTKGSSERTGAFTTTAVPRASSVPEPAVNNPNEEISVEDIPF